VTSGLVESELHSFVVGQCGGKVLNNALQQYRFNVTTQSEEVLVEPFISGASFLALTRNKKKRPTVQTFLEAMFAWADMRGFKANLEVVTSRPRRPDKAVSFSSPQQFVLSLESKV
jgi:hypothetical protein